MEEVNTEAHPASILKKRVIQFSVPTCTELETISDFAQQFHRDLTGEKISDVALSSVFYQPCSTSPTCCITIPRDVTALISYGTNLRTLRGSRIPFQHLTLQLGSTGCPLLWIYLLYTNGIRLETEN